jgi:CheY-like chemotaxis protein
LRLPEREETMKVLVVEDEELLRALIVEALQEAGFQVVEAATGEEAIEKCAEQAADALFTDIRLPGKVDGWDIAEHCRTLHPKLPVIYATGYSHTKERPVPGSRFFHKPYRLDGVIEAICDLLGRRPARA